MVLGEKSNKQTKSHSVKKSEIFCCVLNFEINFRKRKNLRKRRVYAGFGATGRTWTGDLLITKQKKKYKIRPNQRKTAISFIHWNDCFLIKRCVFILLSVRKWSINGRWICSQKATGMHNLYTEKLKSIKNNPRSLRDYTF